MGFGRILLAAIFLAGCSASQVRYDDYLVYSVRVETEEQLRALNSLQDSPECYRFWKYPKGVGSESDVMVRPDKVEEFVRVLQEFRIENMLMIPNVQKLIDEEQPDILKGHHPFGWDRYYKLADIYKWLDDIESKFSDKVTPFKLGQSYEGRDIRGIRISYKPGNPGIFVEANIHAREWIASATATYLINALLTSNDAKIRDIAENIDWYIVPVFNVDGFSYSHEVDRLWRKTRQPNPTSTCVGVDPNRNFDSHWTSNGGASTRPCDETYAGPKPFSEPETLALAKYVRQVKDKISIYLAFHSYGQLLLSPFGHIANEFPPNYKDMQRIAAASIQAIRARHGTSYRHGSTASTLYVASGTSPDWVYNTLNVSLAYTFEFRDKGTHGFILPPKEIIPNAEETLNGILAMVKEARNLQYLK